MEHLEQPDPLTWDDRRLWFEARQQEQARHGGSRFSEQATALTVELQACYCAGAWVACVILAGAIVESQAEVSGRHEAVPAEELLWLRGLRNRLLHENRAEPLLTLEDHWVRRPDWEAAARRAVSLVFLAMYPGA
ncbi:MAG: hypothetical protein WD341_13055 [Tistlia sp.]|uniref:hypothetical protein n=1 Tax=Tistlia sp. TaxID=3057121 RepID=UPI0034A10292